MYESRGAWLIRIGDELHGLRFTLESALARARDVAAAIGNESMRSRGRGFRSASRPVACVPRSAACPGLQGQRSSGQGKSRAGMPTPRTGLRCSDRAALFPSDFSDLSTDLRVLTDDFERPSIVNWFRTDGGLKYSACSKNRIPRCKIALKKAVMSVERRLGMAPQLNDVYLVEPVLQVQHVVSREHFLIDFSQGKFILTDRASVCGTTVNGKTIGGDRRGGHTELHDQDEITLEAKGCPFVFKSRVEFELRQVC